MGSVAVVFPGQGAQYVGMGRDFCEQYDEAKRVFTTVDESVGYSISDICFSGPEDELILTKNTQPAILAASIAVWEILVSKGIKADYVAGLSLGEYSAHVAAHSMDVATAARVVQQRGQFMQDAVPSGEGAMAAVMGLEPEAVIDLCRDAESNGQIVRPANFNCPGQIVVSGHKQAVDSVVELARERGAKRVVPLAVSAPFHCPLMEPAKQRLAGVLADADINDANLCVVSNVTATEVRSRKDIITTLTEQVTSPVRWEESIKYMIGQGVKLFIEAGPGKALSGFIRKIDRSVKTVSVSESADIDCVLDSWQEVC